MPESDANFLAGGGAVGAQMRSLDWRSTPLGDPMSWPHPLRTVVGIMLGAEQPMRLIWGAECTLLYNDGYARILGQRHPAALGRPFRDVWPEVWPELVPVLRRVLDGEGIHQEDAAYTVLRNGYPERAHFALSYTPVRDEQGVVAGVFCACRETTHEVHARQARSAEFGRLQELFEQAPSFIAFLRGPDHRVEMANAACRRLMRQRDPTGRTIREMLPELVDQRFVELLDQVYRTGVPYVGAGVPVRIALPGTAERLHYLNFLYQPVRNAAGEMDGIFVEGNDVTAEHLARQRLQELADTLEARVEERSRELARWWRSSPYLKAIIDGAGRLEALNPAWTQVLGHAEKTLAGGALSALLYADDVAEAATALGSAEGDTSIAFTVRMRHADGRYRAIAWVATHEHETGRLYAVGRDVTAERERAEALAQTEEQLRQSQKMEAIGQLTGGIAHDFNNMLQGIVVPLQLIQRRAQAGELDGVERYAAAGLSSAQRAASLTQRLLAFSRRQPLDSKAVDIAEALLELEGMLRSTVGENIALRFELQPALWPAITDLPQFHNAILNLAINARDAMPDGGTLTVVAENLTLTDKAVAGVRGLEPGDYLRVAVQDTGVGMTEDVIAKAFDPFFTTKPIGQGTGLGLSMIYGYARQSGGYTAIDSTVGEGTTVKLYLPRSTGFAAIVRDAALLGAAAEPSDSRPESVLVVEDDAVVRQLVVDLLQEQGYQVMEAADGSEGMTLLSGALRFDLLLTDMGLPGPNGRQLADYARERLPGIRIVLMTGYAEQATMRASFLGQAMELLVKPFGAEQLVAKVNGIMARPSAG
ncbi:PAS domain-containing protein [uncultured Xylophilus sp.]|uniref:PAS domain-containing protein n=1 Tax=uncultured Xylophilus sp. TaxID=296832 RepID=UPI0025FC15B4|nr:PAS domain-containing protein [uncultured Xylophilus sp.]